MKRGNMKDNPQGKGGGWEKKLESKGLGRLRDAGHML